MAAATATKKEKIYNVSTANCVVSGGWHLQSCTFQFNYVSSVGFVRSMIFQKHRFSSAPKLSADASRWSSGATMWTERAQYIDIEREADWAVHLRFIRLPVPDNFQHIFTHQKSAQHHLPGTTSPKTELSHSLANDSHLRWPNRRIMDHARTRNFNFMWCANTFAFISETRNFYEFEFEWQRAKGASGGSGRTAEQRKCWFHKRTTMLHNCNGARYSVFTRRTFVLQQRFMINSLCAACVCTPSNRTQPLWPEQTNKRKCS